MSPRYDRSKAWRHATDRFRVDQQGILFAIVAANVIVIPVVGDRRRFEQLLRLGRLPAQRTRGGRLPRGRPWHGREGGAV